MSVNSHALGNNPVWTSNTLTRKVSFAAGAGIDTKTFSATSLLTDTGANVTGGTSMRGTVSHMCISNAGPVNIYVGTNASDLTMGVLVQPGGTFSFALDGTAQVTVNDSTKTAVFSVLMFS